MVEPLFHLLDAAPRPVAPFSHAVEVESWVFLSHFERDYAAMNAAYQAFFPVGRLPARTCVGVTALAVGALVEIDLIARRPRVG